jgi:hypothetical protein
MQDPGLSVLSHIKLYLALSARSPVSSCYLTPCVTPRFRSRPLRLCTPRYSSVVCGHHCVVYNPTPETTQHHTTATQTAHTRYCCMWCIICAVAEAAAWMLSTRSTTLAFAKLSFAVMSTLTMKKYTQNQCSAAARMTNRCHTTW